MKHSKDSTNLAIFEVIIKQNIDLYDTRAVRKMKRLNTRTHAHIYIC